MTIKLLPGNPCKSALVFCSEDEFFHMGITPDDLTLQNRKTRLLLARIFDLLREFAGLRREGYFVAVTCRPVNKGGGRFYIQFTDKPSGRLFEFREADDLLDAISQLQGKLNLSHVNICHSDGEYRLYIPAGLHLSKNAAAILSEYSV